jgi:hypothetical protein
MQRRKRVGDADVVLVYYAGGLSPADISAAERAKQRSKRADVQPFSKLLVGGSCLLSVADAVSAVLSGETER